MQITRGVSARKRTGESIFELTEERAKDRNLWRGVLFLALWALLGGMTWLTALFQVREEQHRIAVTVFSFLKYLILLPAVYVLARKQAAHYLADIFEVKDENIAAEFIEEVAFGGRNQQITIDGGEITEEDQKSPIVLIGGPGKIQVNLDSVALLEKLDGEPEIIHARDEPWEIGCFERIREIGHSDMAGKREFAIINLRDQFVKDIPVYARSKDGIRIKIDGVKALFSILRDPTPPKPGEREKNPFTFDRTAVQRLVYDQHVLAGSYARKPIGVKFPWDTTAIHLVKLELEEQVKSHPLSETFASMTPQEVDELLKKEQENRHAKSHTIGREFEEKQPAAPQPLTLTPRTTIRNYFFSPAFQEKAAERGIALHWLDIGTWNLDEKIVLEKVKEARDLNAENRKRRTDIDRRHAQRLLEQVIECIQRVVVATYDERITPSSFTQAEWEELATLLKNNPELMDDYAPRRIAYNIALRIASQTRARNMLKAFRTELLTARHLINAEDKPPIEKDAELKNINNALRQIDHYIGPIS